MLLFHIIVSGCLGWLVFHSYDKIPEFYLVLRSLGSIVSGSVVRLSLMERVWMLTEGQPGGEEQEQRDKKEEVVGE